jgi:hypothetical protein
MTSESQLSVLKAFPEARYFPQLHLVCLHPAGVFNEPLADRILEFIELEERVLEGPFNRFTDLEGLTEIHLNMDHAFQMADRRRAAYRGEPVKSAIFSHRFLGIALGQLYQVLMEGSLIKVQIFRTREAAADWLGVPHHTLYPPTKPAK